MVGIIKHHSGLFLCLNCSNSSLIIVILLQKQYFLSVSAIILVTIIGRKKEMNCIIWLIPMLLKMYFKCKSTANLRIFLKPLLNDSSIYFLFNINFFIFDIYFLFWSRYLIVMCFNSTLNLKCVVMNTPYETVNNVLLKAVKR